MHDQLTNAHIKGLFKSNFELTRYAIRLGKYYMRSGKEMSVTDLIDEVEEHPNEEYLDELQKIDAEDKESNE